MRYISLVILIITILFSPFSFSQPNIDNEKVLSFDSQIVINQDSSIDVLEKITINAKQSAIKHGIVRWLPKSYVDSDGFPHRPGYQITRVLMNNTPIPYSFDKNSSEKLILKLGDANTVLTPGIYTYTIQYHITNVINYIKDGDELYWNITGNSWNLPIEKVTAIVRTPPGNYSLIYSAYTGVVGEKGKDFSVNEISQNELIFKTTSELKPGQGLTIAVALPKNIIHQPSTFELIKTELNKSKTFYLLLVTAIVFFYFIFIWIKEGPSPKKGTIIPVFEPPLNLSPAIIRYVYLKQLIDDKVLATFIIDLAVKGFIKIDNIHQGIVLTKTDKNMSELPDHELKTAQALFGNENVVSINKKYQKNIMTAQDTLNSFLKKEIRTKYFNKGFKYFIPACIVTLLALLVTYYTDPIINSAVFLVIMIPVALYGAIKKPLFFSSNFIVTKLIRILLIGLFAVFIFFVLLFFAGYLYVGDRYDFIALIPVFILFFLLLITVIFYFVLNKPTVEGRKLMDEIEGFKLFISTADRYRINQMNPPNQTPENFENLLPYAVALNVENEWGEHLNQLIYAAGKDPSTYRWHFYIDGKLATGSAFAAYIANSLVTSIGSVSGSASGGKGSSGGGGGGGGGGGW